MKAAVFLILTCWSIILCLCIRIQDIYHAHPTHTNKGSMEGKIVGGVEVPIAMYPYTATLVLTKSVAFCGGSIISDRVILTAAHCLILKLYSKVISLGPQHFEVALGATTWRDGVRYRVCKALPHADYKVDDYQNDIGLVLLSQKIRYGPTIQKVRIANTGKWRNKRYKFEVAGFGMQSDSGVGVEPSEVLRATRMRFIPRDICNSSYSDWEDMFVPESMFCMLGKGWTSDCYGDSGSGILWKARFLVGTVALGREAACGSHTVPSMYTDAVYFRDWIFTNVKRLQNENPVKYCRRLKKLDYSLLTMILSRFE